MDWDTITLDYKYSKAFQVLAYSLIQHHQTPITNTTQAGVISFKNLQEGFLKFGTKSSVRGKPNHEITQPVLEEFQAQLKQLILEIFNPQIPFIEKEV